VTITDAGAQAPAAGPTGRLAELLTAIRDQGGPWTTRRVMRLYLRLASTREIPPGKLRAVARGDLRDLCAWGHLVAHDNPGRLHYTLYSRKDETR
jgi:hypothetical protein